MKTISPVCCNRKCIWPVGTKYCVLDIYSTQDRYTRRLIYEIYLFTVHFYLFIVHFNVTVKKKSIGKLRGSVSIYRSSFLYTKNIYIWSILKIFIYLRLFIKINTFIFEEGIYGNLFLEPHFRGSVSIVVLEPQNLLKMNFVLDFV